MIRVLVALGLLATACTGGTTAPASSAAPDPDLTTSGSAATESTTPPSYATGSTSSSTATTTTTESPVWQRLARMRFPRSEMPAAAIGGLIHVPGGFMETAQGAAGQAFHEVYDPGTDEWSRLADMPEPRHHHMAAAVEGRLYVFGGFSDAGSSTTIGTNTWRYSPASDEWEALADMPAPVAAGAAVPDGDSIVLIGGVPTGTAVYRYSISDDRWEELPPLQTAREHNAAVVVAGTIHVLGGRWAGMTSGSVEVLEPGATAWVDGPEMLEPRSGFAATVWRGAVVVGGGEDLGDLRTLTSVEVLTSTDWVSDAPLPVPLHGFAFVTVDDDLYSVGGSRRAGFVSNSGEMFVRLD